eukprot:m.166229 g.166229  ORF g.166229 m.166229 type:complete len:62 (+) comp15273_c0_seq5:250-435(+)
MNPRGQDLDFGVCSLIDIGWVSLDTNAEGIDGHYGTVYKGSMRCPDNGCCCKIDKFVTSIA